MIVVYGTHGIFNDNIIPEASLTRVIEPYMSEKQVPHLYLFIDHAHCQLTGKVKTSLTARNIKAELIPKRLTNLLQPDDVAWMRLYGMIG